MNHPGSALRRQFWRALAARWGSLWFEEVDPSIFALLRISFGVVGLFTLIGLLDLPLFWSCDGLVASRESAPCQLLGRVDLAWLYPSAVLCFSAVSFAAMAVGYQSRFAVLCSFGSVFLLARWNDLPLSGAHQTLRAMLFCLLWADCGRVWSVDAWLNRATIAPEAGTQRVPVWPLRLMRIQVAAIYLVTGLWKLNNVLWRDGSALHYVFENPQFRRFTMLASPAWDPWTTLGTYATLAWELSFAFLLLHPRARRWALATGVALHLGMWATLELGPFSWVMLASYVAFVHPDSIRRLPAEQWVSRARERFSRKLKVAAV